MIAFLTVLNTIIIIYFLYLHLRKNFSWSINTTFWNKTKLGLQIYYKNEGFLYIPFRNSQKAKLAEDIGRMMQYDHHPKRQSLGAKFSWLKTIEQVNQFEKDYHVVDRKIVEDLVRQFKAKQQSH